MKIDEKMRLDLRRELERLLGTELADVAMESMPPLDYEQLATKADLTNLRIELRGEMAEMRGEMAKMHGDLRSEIAELRSELRGVMAEMRGAMAKMHGDLRSEMASVLNRTIAAQVASVVAMGGLFVGFA